VRLGGKGVNQTKWRVMALWLRRLRTRSRGRTDEACGGGERQEQDKQSAWIVTQAEIITHTPLYVIHCKVSCCCDTWRCSNLQGEESREECELEELRKLPTYLPGKTLSSAARLPTRSRRTPPPVFYTSCSVGCVWGFWWFPPFEMHVYSSIWSEAEALSKYGKQVWHGPRILYYLSMLYAAATP
jgi:hypothetical protein